MYRDRISSGHSSCSVKGRELKQSHFHSAFSIMCTIFSFRLVFKSYLLAPCVYQDFPRGDTETDFRPVCHVTPKHLSQICL